MLAAAGVVFIRLDATWFHRSAKTSANAASNSVSDYRTAAAPLAKVVSPGSNSFIQVQTLPEIPAISAAPNHLIIPSIGVNAPVKRLGLEADGKMAVPHNYTQVGLYSGGAVPGEIGTAVMGAHVDNGSSVAGVFKHLSEIEKGAYIYVTDGEGKQVIFKVTDVKVYPFDQDDTHEVFDQSADAARLNIITCYGTWLPKQNTYDRRIVVFAERVA